jgi:type VI protein secretion system component Hcp
MNDELKKGEVEKDDRQSPKKVEENKMVELSDQDLDKVSGGMNIVKLVDKASPKLFESCTTEHNQK